MYLCLCKLLAINLGKDRCAYPWHAFQKHYLISHMHFKFDPSYFKTAIHEHELWCGYSDELRSVMQMFTL